jgi:hypothetical protein
MEAQSSLMGTKGLFTLKTRVRKMDCGCSARRRERRWCIPISEAATTQCARNPSFPPVGPKCGVCFGEQHAEWNHHSPRYSSRIHPHCGPTHLTFLG